MAKAAPQKTLPDDPLEDATKTQEAETPDTAPEPTPEPQPAVPAAHSETKPEPAKSVEVSPTPAPSGCETYEVTASGIGTFRIAAGSPDAAKYNLMRERGICDSGLEWTIRKL